jgi:uncharacterized protein (DUF433 family)
LSDVSKPFSLRMDEGTHEHLLARAVRTGASASQLVNRYVKEGLRMDEHPGIGFVTAPDGERVPVLAGRPRLRLVDVIGTWRAEHQDVAATARYFGIADDDIQTVLRYYAAHRDELDAAIRAHLAAQDNFERVIRQRNARAARRAANV